jgi:hypothetical protein
LAISTPRPTSVVEGGGGPEYEMAKGMAVVEPQDWEGTMSQAIKTSDRLAIPQSGCRVPWGPSIGNQQQVSPPRA